MMRPGSSRMSVESLWLSLWFSFHFCEEQRNKDPPTVQYSKEQWWHHRKCPMSSCSSQAVSSIEHMQHNTINFPVLSAYLHVQKCFSVSQHYCCFPDTSVHHCYVCVCVCASLSRESCPNKHYRLGQRTHTKKKEFPIMSGNSLSLTVWSLCSLEGNGIMHGRISFCG